MALKAMIELENITKTYHMGKVEVPALRGVSLGVQPGEMVALIGASGSGKSTLMNIVGFLDQPTSGRYRLDGIDVSQLNDNRLAEMRNRKVGFVFQTYNLLPRTAALANVELPLIYSGTAPGDRQRQATEALTTVALSDRMAHKPNELSGGQRQRVAIARALVNKPSLILADEPTGNLDTATGADIMRLFDVLHKQGNTIILVTHEADVARYADRIVHVRDGTVEKEEITTGITA